MDFKNILPSYFEYFDGFARKQICPFCKAFTNKIAAMGQDYHCHNDSCFSVYKYKITRVWGNFIYEIFYLNNKTIYRSAKLENKTIITYEFTINKYRKNGYLDFDFENLDKMKDRVENIKIFS